MLISSVHFDHLYAINHVLSPDNSLLCPETHQRIAIHMCRGNMEAGMAVPSAKCPRERCCEEAQRLGRRGKAEGGGRRWRKANRRREEGGARAGAGCHGRMLASARASLATTAPDGEPKSRFLKTSKAPTPRSFLAQPSLGPSSLEVWKYISPSICAKWTRIL